MPALRVQIPQVRGRTRSAPSSIALIQPVPPPGVQMQPMTQQPVMYQPGIAETTYTWDLPPEKEFDVSHCCHECSTCGGKQKIKLYKDDIAFEETCARSDPHTAPVL